MHTTIPKGKKEHRAGQTSDFASPGLMSKRSSALRVLSALLTATHFLLLGWFRILLAVFFGRYLMTLAFPISWDLQGFNFTASHNGLSGSPCRDSFGTCLPQRLSFVTEGGPLLLSCILDSKTWLWYHLSPLPKGNPVRTIGYTARLVPSQPAGSPSYKMRPLCLNYSLELGSCLVKAASFPSPHLHSPLSCLAVCIYLLLSKKHSSG